MPGARPETVVVGGHLDSVPNGGWLDGPLGVLAGVEALRRFRGTTPPVTLAVVDFADEEGAVLAQPARVVGCERQSHARKRLAEHSIEDVHAPTSSCTSAYDFTADVLSDAFDLTKAIRRAKAHPDAQIADVLLDQTIFAGVGDIIKSEVPFGRGRVHSRRCETFPLGGCAPLPSTPGRSQSGFSS